MKLKSISVDNFLSLENFKWQDIDEHLNIIVGPNGAGKTNLFRALRAAVDALSLTDRPVISRGLLHHANTGPGIRIILDLEFNGAWEQDILRSFLAAALCDKAAFQPSRPFSDAARAEMSVFLLTRLKLDHINPFLRGRLLVTGDPAGRWTSTYHSLPGEPFFSWGLDRDQISSLAGRESPSEGSRPLIDLWTAGFDGTELESWNDYVNGHSAGPPPMPDMARALAAIEHRLSVQVTGMDLSSRSHRHFFNQMAVSEQRSVQYGLLQVLHRILQRAFVFTDNVRQVPIYSFNSGDASRPTLNLSSGADLAIALFRLKNGAEGDRARYQDVSNTFNALTGRHFDVGFRATAAGETDTSPERTTLEIRVVQGEWGDVPLEYSGAGMAEALFLSSTLVDDDRIIALDEPASNLHPTVQTQLVGEMRRHGRAQFLIATHAPMLLQPETITQTSRFFIRDGATHRACLDRDDITSNDMEALEKELRASVTARALLFSQGAILVEGETELGVLPVWFAERFRTSLDALDLVLYSVGGHRNFEKMVRYLNQFEVPWAIVCDGKIIGDAGERCSVLEQVLKATKVGDPSAVNLLTPFSDRLAILESYGIFTTALRRCDEFEKVPIVAEHEGKAAESLGTTSKPRIGRLIAEEHPCPAEIANMLVKVRAHLLPGEQNHGTSSNGRLQ